MIFGLFKKKYPLIKPEMFEPADKPISTAEAKKIFKDFMKQIGYFEKDELSENASFLADDMKENEQFLKDDISDKKAEIKEEKDRLKKLKSKLKAVGDDSLNEVEEEIEMCEEDVASLMLELDEANKDLADYKADKKSFLIEYINNQTQERN